MNKARAAVIVSVTSLALPLLVAAPVAAGQSGFSHQRDAKAHGTLVTPFESPAVAPSDQAPMPAKLAATGGTPARATGSLGSRSADPRIQAPTNTSNQEQVFKTFSAYSHADAPNGNPPDVSVATNGTQILQVNNFKLRVFNRSGGQLIEATTATFFVQDATFTIADPQVVYDAATGRWFLTAMEFNSGATGGKVLLMVSAASTLTGSTSWMRYVVADSPSVLNDQPKLGLTSDKVLIAWERFASGSSFDGPEALVADKAEAVNFAGTLDTTQSLGGTNDFGMAPANNLSPGTTGYFVETGTPGSLLLTVLQVTGRPGDSSTFFSPSQQTLSIATASPPAADSGLSAARIQTGDTRIANAVWNNGVLSFVAGQGCLPYGSSGSTPTACIRLWRVNTPSLSIAEDSTYSINTAFVYTPAITYSKNGDLHMVFDLSVGGFLAPSVFVAGRPAGSGSWGSFNPVTEDFGPNDYTGVDSAPYRWGDFNSIVPDPSNPTDAIAAGEGTDATTATAPNFRIVVAHVGIPLDTLTLTRSATAITYGGAVTLSGKLTRPGGQPVVGETIQLWRKLAPASAFTDYKNLVTGSTGVASYVDKPTANAQYQWRYAGVTTFDATDSTVLDEGTLATESGTVSEPVMVKVGASENHSTIVHGASVKLSFLVTPNEHGRLIYLQRYIGGRWRNVTSHALSSASAWTFTEVLATAGTYLFRGLETGDATHATGWSVTLRVRAT